MENKLRKEHLNRQDKIHKSGNYRESFLKESRNKSSPQHIEHFRKTLAFKEALIEQYYGCFYYFGTHFILLDWSTEEFATGNKLVPTDRQTKQLFESLYRIAMEDFGAIIQSIRATNVVWDYDNQGNYKPNIEIKPSLRCDTVFSLKDEIYINRLVSKSLR